eukprot:Cvel_15004.t2-p1 / transcript=Cvel_15004.t2 / gene=Cvel_15004 / organism=Chromera_velia_CCMP2878 / gene_product=Zinc finger protein 571, putative / transcript_product=Zinc finger protein 571, putative / location=Cvel_scaffold1091:46537-48159(-) / protein_length=256 / sequence_SO=supercontig / SO=protein_coding / is_pseudo=false
MLADLGPSALLAESPDTVMRTNTLPPAFFAVVSLPSVGTKTSDPDRSWRNLPAETNFLFLKALSALPCGGASLASVLADATTSALFALSALTTVFANPTSSALDAGVLQTPVDANGDPPTVSAIMTSASVLANAASSAFFTKRALKSVHANLRPPAVLAVIALTPMLAYSLPPTIFTEVSSPPMWADWVLPTNNFLRSTAGGLCACIRARSRALVERCVPTCLHPLNLGYRQSRKMKTSPIFLPLQGCPRPVCNNT